MLKLWTPLIGLSFVRLVASFTSPIAVNRWDNNIFQQVIRCSENLSRNCHSDKSTLPPLAEENDIAAVSSLERAYTPGATTTRRNIFGDAITAYSVASLALCSNPTVALASSAKNRVTGYAVQRPEREWAYMLSGAQYNILREGGTERQFSSILEEEERSGKYVCAGCGNTLFASPAKFHSGTGWPSFATAFDGVEVENVNVVQAGLVGAEVRCKNCGGHLGDIFRDGFLFVGTPAFKSGKRYCVDGAALVFKPDDGSEDVIGDTVPTKRVGELPDFLKGPKISPQ